MLNIVIHSLGVNEICMLRNYLISLHRFYYRFYRGSMDSPIMPAIAFTLMLTSILGSIDMVFNNSIYINWLKSIHELMVILPGFLVILIVYIWYRSNLPSDRELAKTKGMWAAVISCILSVIIFLISSIMYH